MMMTDRRTLDVLATATALQREASLAVVAGNQSLADWLLTAADVLTDHPADDGRRLLSRVLDSMHTMTECPDDCGCNGGPR